MTDGAAVVVANKPSPWLQWMRFGEVVGQTASLLPEPVRDQLFKTLQPVMSLQVGEAIGGAEILVAYFVDVPAHRSACVQLDQSLFVNPIRFPNTTVHLGAILDHFSPLGPHAFGQIWMSVLDLAAACNPEIPVGSARDYIKQRMNTVGHPNTTTAAAAAGALPFELPNQAQLDGILSSVMSAFPGLSDCVQQIITPLTAAANNNTNNADAAGDISGMVENLQNTLLRPLLENLIVSSSPGVAPPDVGPALNQIIDGFKSLNEVINTGGGRKTDGDVSM